MCFIGLPAEVKSAGTQAEDQNQAEVLLGAPDRGLLQADHRSRKDNQCKDHGSCSPANQEENLLCAQLPPRAQRFTVPFRDPDAPAADRHHVPDGPDDRFVDAAPAPRRRGCRG